MPFSPAKGLSLQTAGSNPGVWGVGAATALNEGVISILDNNLGGLVSLSLSSSNVSLTPTQSQCCIIRCGGTLLSNVTVTTSCIGFFFVENLTSGNFTLTFTNGVAGTAVAKGRSSLISDATNGVRVASTDSFPTGTRMLFQQLTAPTGWTKDTSVAESAIMVSSNGGEAGGSSDFTSVFSPRFISQANIPNYSLPVSDPGHTHVYTRTTDSSPRNVQAGNNFNGNSSDFTQRSFTGISVGSGGSGAPLDFYVRYRGCCIAVKN